MATEWLECSKKAADRKYAKPGNWNWLRDYSGSFFIRNPEVCWFLSEPGPTRTIHSKGTWFSLLRKSEQCLLLLSEQVLLYSRPVTWVQTGILSKELESFSVSLGGGLRGSSHAAAAWMVFWNPIPPKQPHPNKTVSANTCHSCLCESSSRKKADRVWANSLCKLLLTWVWGAGMLPLNCYYSRSFSFPG